MFYTTKIDTPIVELQSTPYPGAYRNFIVILIESLLEILRKAEEKKVETSERVVPSKRQPY